MNTQELVDHNLRLALGDMHIQLVLARVRIAELEEQLKALTPPTAQTDPETKPVPNKLNGSAKETSP